jgi:hypothetical protein
MENSGPGRNSIRGVGLDNGLSPSQLTCGNSVMSGHVALDIKLTKLLERQGHESQQNEKSEL